MAENIPRENPKNADDFLDETEVITRMMQVLHKFHLYDLEKLDWKVIIEVNVSRLTLISKELTLWKQQPF